MKILIIRLSSIGDCVLSSPVLEALRDRYPDAHITWAVQAKSVSVVQGLPGLDEVLLWDSKSREKSLKRALSHTWRERYDVALDLHGLDKAALFALASRAKRRISGTSARYLANKMSNERVDENEFMHARLFYLRRASLLDIAPDAATRYYPKVPILAEHRARAAKFLQEHKIQPGMRILGLNLGASETEKLWPPERFAQVSHTLLGEDANLRVVIFGAPADAWLYKRFETEFNRLHGHATQLDPRVVSAVGVLGLMDVAAISEQCSAFISADTGPMHIAAAVGAPVLALFGPTSAAHTGPVQNPDGAPIRVLDARQITGRDDAPMETHSVETVLREVLAQIEKSPAPALRLLYGAA